MSRPVTENPHAHRSLSRGILESTAHNQRHLFRLTLTWHLLLAPLVAGTSCCRNLTSGNAATILPAGLGALWDCSAAGMAVAGGDRIRVSARGTSD